MGKLNSAAFTGFLFCFIAIIFGIVTNGGINAVLNLIHFPSFIVTFGGALFAVLMTADSFTDFLKKAITLIVDGSDPELVRDILESQMIHTEELLIMEVVTEGVLSIRAGENTRIIREKNSLCNRNGNQGGRECYPFGCLSYFKY